MTNENIICDCGHSDKEHEMKYTKNLTFSIDNCRECECKQFSIYKKISLTP